MKLIDKIIKILINFKYKREPFMTWSWGIDDIHEINIISAEYYNDHYRYGTTYDYYNAESEEINMKDYQSDYDHCYETGEYDDQYCYECPYKEECSGYEEPH